MYKHLQSSLTVFLFIFLFGCNNDKHQSTQKQGIVQNQGVTSITLDLINKGPKGFELDYFPRDLIHSAHIRECEIIQQDSTSERVARKIKFDENGNIIQDENNFYFYWFKGTVRGSFQYFYDRKNNLLKMVGIPEENSRDSIMTIYNYNQNGLLYKRDNYRFAKKLKPGSNRHLPSPEVLNLKQYLKERLLKKIDTSWNLTHQNNYEQLLKTETLFLLNQLITVTLITLS